jgi:hypothetical protein
MTKSTSLFLIRGGVFLVFLSFIFIPDGMFRGLVHTWKAGMLLGVLMTVSGVALWLNSKRSMAKEQGHNSLMWDASALTNDRRARCINFFEDVGANQALLAAGMIGAGGAAASHAIHSSDHDDAFTILAFNIDGTPMMGDSGVDIHGNPFGVTQDTFGHNDFIGLSSSEVDFGSNDYGMSSDPFGS